jgi:hypothetical protein
MISGCYAVTCLGLQDPWAQSQLLLNDFDVLHQFRRGKIAAIDFLLQILIRAAHGKNLLLQEARDGISNRRA